MTGHLPAKPHRQHCSTNSRDRKGEHPERHLAGFTGWLQADAFAGYNRLYEPDRKPGPIRDVLCWAHLWMPPPLQVFSSRFWQMPRLRSSIRPVMATRPALPALMVNPQAEAQSRAASSKLDAPNGFLPAPVRPVSPSRSVHTSQPRRPSCSSADPCSVPTPLVAPGCRRFLRIAAAPRRPAPSCSRRRPRPRWPDGACAAWPAKSTFSTASASPIGCRE